MPTPPLKLRILSLSACVLAVAAPTLGADPASAKQPLRTLTSKQSSLPASLPAPLPVTLDIPTSDGLSRFELLTPDAPTSPATRLDTDPKAAVISRLPGFELSARIVLRCADAKAAQRIGAKFKLAFAAADPSNPPGPTLREFFIAPAASVRAAAQLALALRADPEVLEAYLDLKLPIVDRTIPADPLLPDQWHLVNTVIPAADLNVEGAWKSGFTGAGVTVCILEGGWSTTHPDLASKFNALASQPDAGASSHGTSTAGLVGAAANNGLGGSGVAYDALLSRAYYGGLTAIANAFAFENTLNHIKSNSWGPSDNGRLWTMSSMERAALADAITTGRAGLGEIFVWAGGNGRTSNADRTDYDPYASSRYTLCIGAVDSEDAVSTYSEPGASLLVVAPSSRLLSGLPDRKIVTTTIGDTYTFNFGGTSSAAPIAAGAIALMLDANPNLSWRDVPHILIRTARKCSPANASWALNGASRWTSHDFGFGAIDASAAAALASTWTSVPPEVTWSSPVTVVNTPIPDNAPASMGGGIASTITMGQRLRVERAQIILTAPHTSVGQLRVSLTSPSGTLSLFAAPRTDTTSAQYTAYEFTSVRAWDEFANGPWTLRIADEAAGTTGTLNQWSLRIFGTAPACPTDWNFDGQSSADDIFSFLDSWFANAADFGADGSTDADDIFLFLDAWFAASSGC